MKTLIVFTIAILIGLSTSNFTFLEMNDVPGTITIELNCLAGVPFNITKAVPKPTVVERGGHMSFKAVGSFNVDTNVQKLKVYTKINGVDAQTVTPDLPKQGVVPKDTSFIFTYEDNVPAIAPAGHYEVYMYLMDNTNKPVSCLKGSFTLANN